jgi:hypothetical protein
VRWLSLAIATTLVVLACSPSEQTAAGIVTAIDTLGLGQVQGFTLRTQDGESLGFTLHGPVALDGDAFPPDHLREHMATAEAIAVAYRTEGDARVVVRLTDASWLDR